MSGEIGALLAMGALGGGYLMFDAVKRFKQYRAIKDTPTTTIQAASLGDGEIKGTAKAPQDAELLETPITGEECLFTKYVLQQKSSEGDWAAISQGVYGIPFLVEDETGTLFVNPQYTEPTTSEESFSGLFTLESWKDEFSVGDSEISGLVSDLDIDIEPTESEEDRHEDRKFTREEFEEDSTLGRFVERTDLTNQITSDSMLMESKYRIIEKDYLYPGEDVYLFGNLEASDMTETEIDDDYDMTVRNADGQSGMFFISNQDEDELLAERRRYPFMAFPAGAILFAACLVFLLMYIGIL